MSGEIKKEESDKVKQEQESHKITQEALAATTAARESLQKRIYWKSRFKSQVCAWFVTCLTAIPLGLGVVAGLGMKTKDPILGWLLLGGALCLAVATLANAFLGTTVRQLHAAIQTRCLTFFLRQESKATGIQFGAEG